MLSVVQMQVAALQSAQLIAGAHLSNLVLCEACTSTNHHILAALDHSLSEHSHAAAHPPIQVFPTAKEPA